METINVVPFASWDKMSGILKLDDRTHVRVDSAKLQFTLFVNGAPVVSANHRNLFYFEWLRQQPAAPPPPPSPLPSGELADNGLLVALLSFFF